MSEFLSAIAGPAFMIGFMGCYVVGIRKFLKK
jgi:hypothetical protein